MNHHPLIERNPAVLLGKPVLKGTRISVELIIRKLSGGHTIEQLLEDYPHLRYEQILAALAYPQQSLASRE